MFKPFKSIINKKFLIYVSLGFVITLFFIYLFFVILRNYVGQENLIKIDQSILNFIVTTRTDDLNNIMLFTTYIGKGEIIIFGVIAFAIILYLLKHFQYLTVLLISVIGGEIFVTVVKNIIERPRPPLISSLTQENTFSFPSGHAFIAIAFYGFLTYIIFYFFKRKFFKIITLFVGIILILAIGYSRIYLGVHWTSDVLGSYASATAWLTFLITALHVRKKFKPSLNKPNIKYVNIFKIAVILFSAWFLFLIYFYKSHPLKPSNTTYKNIFINIPKKDVSKKLFEKYSGYSETMFAQKIEPINIIIVGSENEINRIFEKSNWLPLDTFNIKNMALLSYRSLANKPYPTAPGFPSFWNNKPNKLEFNQSTAKNSAQERYHIHLWDTPFLLDNQISIWLGTTHFDQHQDTFLPIHSVAPNLDQSREKVKNDIINTGLAKTFEKIFVTGPTSGKNIYGSKFYTDGYAYILYLQN